MFHAFRLLDTVVHEAEIIENQINNNKLKQNNDRLTGSPTNHTLLFLLTGISDEISVKKA